MRAQEDTLLQVESLTERQGVNTFGHQHQAKGRFEGRAGRVRYDWRNRSVYNTLLEEPFVTLNNLADFRHRFLQSDSLALSYRFFLNDYAANATRIGGARVALSGHWQWLEQHRLRARAFLGSAYDRRGSRQDLGPSSGGKLYYSFRDTSLQLQAFGRAREEVKFVSPRTQQYFSARGGVEKRFNAQTRLFAGGGYRLRQTEDYLAGNIRQVLSDTLQFRLEGDYPLLKNLVLRSENRWLTPDRAFSYRAAQPETELRQNVAYGQTEVHLNEQLRYQSDQWRLEGSLRYDQRNRRYSLENNRNLTEKALENTLEKERRKNIRERTTTYRLGGRFQATQSQRFTAEYTAQLLRVDTESELNTQDRDEVLYSFRLGWHSHWSRQFKTALQLSGNRKSLVYISAEQSIDNFTERFLKMKPTFTWARSWFRWRGRSELWVNYHVREFDSEQLKNRSNRILMFDHDFTLYLPGQDRLKLHLLRRENRLGILNWDRFTESPLDTTISWDLEAEWQHAFRRWKPLKGWSGQLGYRLFRQTRDFRAGIRGNQSGPRKAFLQNVTLQHGPTIGLEAPASPRLQFSASLWLRFNRIFWNAQVTEAPFLGQTFRQSEIERRQKNLFPFFTVRLNYRL